MTKEEIVNLANRCSRKIWEICMEEPRFSTNDCPKGANGLSDIVLNVILKEFPAIKECSSLPSNLDEAAAEWMAEREKLIREKYYPFVFNAKDIFDAFKAGAEWMTRQGEIQEHFVIEHTEASHGHPVIVCYPESFGIGDKVIVQIRKK